MAFLNARRFRGALVFALSVATFACGSDDNKENKDGNSNTVEGRCEAIADKIYGCDLSCAEPSGQASFVSTCVAADPAFTEADRDEIVDASCVEIETALCGGCPGSQVCAPLQNAGVCVVSYDEESINIPNDAQGCSTDSASGGCPGGFGCLTNPGETEGYCLRICTP